MCILGRTHASPDIDWKTRWENLGKNSVLKQTQVKSPEKWQVFYDRVSGTWDRMAGIGSGAGELIAGFIAGQDWVPPKGSILELGCGPGNLSLALASHGFRVTALDLSAGMIRALERKIHTRRIANIRSLTADWKTLAPQPSHDLAVAAFFPEVCHPDGIFRMERLAKKTCALVLANGTETFPLRQAIWRRVMDNPLPNAREHLTCARNFLCQVGRHPDVFDLSCPATLDIEYPLAEDYFQAYFDMFGRSGRLLDSAIETVLRPHVRGNRLCLEGKAGFAVVFWSVSHRLSGHGSND